MRLCSSHATDRAWRAVLFPAAVDALGAWSLNALAYLRDGFPAWEKRLMTYRSRALFSLSQPA